MLAVVLAGIMVAGDLPSRWGLAVIQAGQGKRLLDYVVLGNAVDIFTGTGWLWAIVLTVFLGLRWIARRTNDAAFPIRLATGVTATLWLLTWLGGIGATEFRIQRGLYPTVADLRVGTELSYWISAAGTFWFDRYLYPSFVAVPIGVVLIGWMASTRWSPMFALLSKRGLVGFLITASALWLTAWSFWFFSASLLPSVMDRREVSMPLGNLASIWVSGRNVRWGVRAGIESTIGTSESEAVGAAMLGLPNASSYPKEASACLPHPLERRFPRTELARPEPKGAYAGKLLVALHSLSAKLFGEGAPSHVHVWQLTLESFRAEDIHALNPRAPRELSPFVTALYENSVPGIRTIPIRKMSQAGIRTSQAISALTCGLGSFPYDVSFARDIGVVPARCITDVLSDSGFDTAFVYGEKPAFDNMLEFFTAHRVSHFVVEKNFPPGLPSGGWGVGDIALMRHVMDLRRRAAETADRDAYTFLLTVTNHHPFGLPEDAPDSLRTELDGIAHRAGNALPEEDRARLAVHAYTDAAVRVFFDQLRDSPWAHNSIVVLTGDHSTGDPSAWLAPSGDPERERQWQKAIGHIPGLIILPQPWLDRLADPGAVQHEVAAVQEQVQDMELSQNDIPTMLLALLAESPALRKLANEKQWHTMGGQRTSPFYEFASAPETVVWGINAGSALFRKTADGRLIETREVCTPEVENKTSAPTLEPIASFLGALLRNYDAKCHDVLTPFASKTP